MGEQKVATTTDSEELRVFMRRLLNDIHALDKMMLLGMIESGKRRIGAEQELFLVDQNWRVAPVSLEILQRVADPHFTTEIAQFNLEINLDPILFGGDCLSQLEKRLSRLIARARAAARACGAEVVMTGILPTIRKSDLGLSNMTPKPRYFALNTALARLRGGPYEFRVNGTDELIMKHDSWMLEACCTSFQVHFQSGSEEFPNLYNIAQVATAPVLAAAANAPLLFGKRLWRETRIPLFEQSIDTRQASNHLRERSSRVSFGHRWVKDSVMELFEEDLARFRILLGAPIDEDPLAMLREGRIPQLQALRVYNSTVWRWNRPCYGITDGAPGLRIEARAFPAGPTVLDEVANGAFFFGLMSGLANEHRDITDRIQFDDAKSNFHAAARFGLDAQLMWLDGEVLPACDLICRRLLPLAREGLLEAGIRPADVDRYLGVIDERVKSGRTGSQWMLSSFSDMRKEATKDEALTALTAATVARQVEGKPVHEWSPARAAEGSMSKQTHLCVEEFMTSDLFTVHEDEAVDLVANLMDWKRIRHIPVENEAGTLVGLVSCFEVLRHLEMSISEGADQSVPVGKIMIRDPLTVPPETPTLDAIMLMRRERVDCLPVVKDGRLVGILTERDFIDVAARLLEQKLAGSERAAAGTSA
ncbi:MAG TPA: CBS domain-containing protein [Blastocatellia bacterium]|nr:CBS domain-containing protein [Blastocatellia bacterium]